MKDKPVRVRAVKGFRSFERRVTPGNRSLQRKEESPQGPFDSREKSILCAHQALAKKAIDPIILEVQGIVSFTEYFVICSGKSDRQVRAIANQIEMALKERNILPHHIEGMETAHWVLMDYDDVVIHIFFDPVRSFYDLEGLWSDAERVEVRPRSEGSS